MSEPTIPFEGKDEAGMAVLLFNLHFAETPDDAAIERLAQEAIKFMVRRAEKRKMAMADVVCATQEVMARLLISPFMLQKRDRAETEALINKMMGLATRRAFDMLDGQAPGNGSVAETGN